MIDKKTLISFAKLNGMRPWQQEKHYIQSVILVAMSEEQVVFKGGTYLWFFHGLNRFSEDLDFTSEKVPKDMDKKISKSLLMMGIENKTKIMTDDERSFSFRISANGPLNTVDIDRCHVYVEISKREKVLQPTISSKIDIPAYNLPIKVIKGMSLEEVTTEKIRAIITRDKARDMYDLAFIIQNKNVKFNEEMTNEKLKYYGIKFSKIDFEKKLNGKKEIWKQELSQLIFDELQDADEIIKMIKNWVE